MTAATNRELAVRLSALSCAFAVGACSAASAAPIDGGIASERDPGVDDGSTGDAGAADRPVAIGPDGYFYVDGVRTVVVGVEEERNLLTDAQVDALAPRLREAGVNFVIVYLGNVQSDYFYEKLEREGIYVAQHLGTLKREVSGGFSNTGGVIGTVPDDAWFDERLADIEAVVPRLAARRNILFWWLGGEFVEPVFHTAEGSATVRDHVRRYRDAIRRLDPLGRPFTVSHHYVEAVGDAALAYVDYRDLTDFAWFTVATHFHLGDFVPGGGWWPVAQATEFPFLLSSVMRHAWELDGERPIFFGGWFGQAPAFGACDAADQGGRVHDKWAAISAVPYMGFSTYHLDEWRGNGIPHALFTWSGTDWIPTAAGRALREIATSTSLRSGEPELGLSAPAHSELRYLMNVPAGATRLTFVTRGGTGDVDLYVRSSSAPTTTTHDCRSAALGNVETCSFADPAPGSWYVMLRAASAFSGVTLVGGLEP